MTLVGPPSTLTANRCLSWPTLVTMRPTRLNRQYSPHSPERGAWRIAKGAQAIMIDQTSFWPDDARLAVSVSLMFEGGGQPISGAPGVIPEPIKNGLPDMATNGVFQYGI